MDSFKEVQKACVNMIKAEQGFKAQTKGLKDLIEKSYISQAKIAEKIGITPEAFSRKLHSNSWNVVQVSSILIVLKKYNVNPYD